MSVYTPQNASVNILRGSGRNFILENKLNVQRNSTIKPYTSPMSNRVHDVRDQPGVSIMTSNSFTQKQIPTAKSTMAKNVPRRYIELAKPKEFRVKTTDLVTDLIQQRLSSMASIRQDPFPSYAPLRTSYNEPVDPVVASAHILLQSALPKRRTLTNLLQKTSSARLIPFKTSSAKQLNFIKPARSPRTYSKKAGRTLKTGGSRTAEPCPAASGDFSSDSLSAISSSVLRCRTLKNSKRPEVKRNSKLNLKLNKRKPTLIKMKEAVVSDSSDPDSCEESTVRSAKEYARHINNDPPVEQTPVEPTIAKTFAQSYMEQITHQPHDSVANVMVNLPKSALEGDYEVSPDAGCPSDIRPLSVLERSDTLAALNKRYNELCQELNNLPVNSDTYRVKNRKVQMEKELIKIEESLVIFSRPKVFVKRT